MTESVEKTTETRGRKAITDGTKRDYHATCLLDTFEKAAFKAALAEAEAHEGKKLSGSAYLHKIVRAHLEEVAARLGLPMAPIPNSSVSAATEVSEPEAVPAPTESPALADMV